MRSHTRTLPIGDVSDAAAPGARAEARVRPATPPHPSISGAGWRCASPECSTPDRRPLDACAGAARAGTSRATPRRRLQSSPPRSW
eukprot:4179753-Prymnesium_polylepis.1